MRQLWELLFGVLRAGSGTAPPSLQLESLDSDSTDSVFLSSVLNLVFPPNLILSNYWPVAALLNQSWCTEGLLHSSTLFHTILCGRIISQKQENITFKELIFEKRRDCVEALVLIAAQSGLICSDQSCGENW